MNKYIYIIGTICVVFVVASLFIKILPFLLIAGVIIYGITKLKGRTASNKEDHNMNTTSNSNAGYDSQNMYSSSDDYTNGEVIDVDDYEDVDNK